MKFKAKIIFSFIFTILAGLLPLHSGDVNDDLTVHLSIDRESYNYNEPVILHISIRNNSSKTTSFEIFENTASTLPDFTTFQPVVFDLMGREAENIIPYRKENLPTSEVIKKMTRRKVSIGVNETFTCNVDLKKVYNLGSKTYRVRSYFVPDFTRRKIIYSVNELTFRIIKEDGKPFGGERTIAETRITPGEIVLLSLEAEKRKNWRNMFKYINLKEYIYSFHNFVRPYNDAGPRERIEILAKFRRFLARHRHDYIVHFNVVSEEIEKNRKYASVDAIVERYGVRKNERFKYMFRLEKRRNIWLINAVEATVLKGIGK